ncbi:MAG TPA: ATP-binding cassette domain-containing protein, partial [Vicinamibacterales bacterium]|nr:ATP-binding cassette domain-containing protein [Vicinamibacterales bacterium]
RCPERVEPHRRRSQSRHRLFRSVTGAVLEIDGASKDYRALRPLRIQHLSVAASESVAIVGLDQAAAEVLVNLATGASLPDAGEVRVFGRATSAIADADDWLSVVDRFGIVSGRAVLLDELTVIQNLAMPFTLDIEPPPPDVRDRATSLANEVGLPDSVAQRRIADLDAAARLRVRLGRALALGPSLLLLEHASAGLSAADATETGRRIRSVAGRRGAAVLALTVDEGFARAVADRVLTLEAATGRLRERGVRKWFRG